MHRNWYYQVVLKLSGYFFFYIFLFLLFRYFIHL